MKRAQVEHTFNWIFVLVAGAFFLLLFIVLMRTILSVNDDRQEINSLHTLHGIIEKSRAETNVITNVTVPRMSTECIGSTFTFAFEEQLRSYNAHTIFAPKTVEGGTVLYSRNFSVGIPITTFTYLFPQNTLYIINNVEVTLPPGVDSSTQLSADTSGYERVILVTDAPVLSLEVSPNQEVYGIFVTPTHVEFSTYTDRFIAQGSAPYFDANFLLGAIASTDQERYTCALENALLHTKFLARLNAERAGLLAAQPNTLACQRAYTNAEEAFHLLENPTQQNIDAARRELITSHVVLRGQACPNIL